MAFALSQEQMRAEILKCGKNPSYFISNFAKISHPIKGEIPFKMYPFQQDCIKDFSDHRFCIINKARQLGLSTTAAAYIAWMMLFYKGKSILIVATKQSTAANLVRKVKMIVQNVPDWMAISKVKLDNAYTCELDNGSWVKASSTSADAGRSEALSLLVIDEAAHIENIGNMWAAVYPTLSCVTGNTLVLTKDGFVKIEEFHKNKSIGDYFELDNLEVYGKNGIERVSHGYVSPESETLVFTTKKGLKLEVTKKHPLFAIQDKANPKMTFARDLKVGDNLRIEHGMNVFGNKDYVFDPIKNENIQITNEIAYMLGGYIAEGWSFKNRGNLSGIAISNQDDEFRSVFLESKFVKNFHATKDKCKMLCCSIELCRVFQLLGVDLSKKCYDKSTPVSVFGFSKEKMGHYLAGLFDGDGHIGTQRAALSSTSSELIRETQLLMLNADIICKKVFIPKKSSDIGTRVMPSGQIVQSLADSYILDIPQSQFEKFRNFIPVRIKRKQERLSVKVFKLDRQLFLSPNACVYPQLREIMKKFGKSDKWFRDNGVRVDKIIKGADIERSKIKTLRTLMISENISLSDQDEEFFENFGSDTHLWDPIVKIENSHNKTYDFTVPKTHSFLQNGILGSNTGGRAIALSSPNGSSGWFFETFQGAAKQNNDFYPITLPWDVHPDRDAKWFQKETRNMSPREIAQELLCDFSMSGETLLSQDAMKFLQDLVMEPKYTSGFDKNLWIWQTAQPELKYFLVADVARGDGADFSTFHIFRMDTMEQVAEYKGKLPTDAFGDLIYESSKEYGFCLTVVENATVGWAVLDRLKEKRHPNIYYSTKGDHAYIDQYKAEGVNNAVAGFSTTPGTRPLIIAKMEEYIRNRKLLIYSSRTFTELKTFIWYNGKAQASKGKNDDLVMPAAISCFIRDTALAENKLDIEYKKASLSSMGVSRSSLMTNIPGMMNLPSYDLYGNSIVDIRDFGLTKSSETKSKNFIPIGIFKG